jgi:hypothetical protein
MFATQEQEQDVDNNGKDVNVCHFDGKREKKELSRKEKLSVRQIIFYRDSSFSFSLQKKAFLFSNLCSLVIIVMIRKEESEETLDGDS